MSLAKLPSLIYCAECARERQGTYARIDFWSLQGIGYALHFHRESRSLPLPLTSLKDNLPGITKTTILFHL